MNYRHAFHAGNFADVLKHAVLARILVYLTQKDAPLRFIDTHAGAGRYDLASAEARRSPEWREGIARVLKARPPAPVAALLAPYLEAVGPHDARACRRPIPARRRSPRRCCARRTASRSARRNPEEREALIAALGRDKRLSIVGTDGYVALNAYCPPKERRGLVLIDPPFEEPDELKRVEEALGAADSQMADRNLCRLAADPRGGQPTPASSTRSLRSARRTSCRLELDVGPGAAGAHGQEPLARAGLLVVNPPHTLCRRSAHAHALARALLARGGRGAHVCEWLTEPR